MSKHTPGPWIYIGNGDIVARSENYCGGEKDIASVFLTANDEDEANASRIVACVNACDGLPTNWLEKNRIQDRWSDELKSASKCNGEFVRGSEFQAIRDQRDQLLEALQNLSIVMRELHDHWDNDRDMKVGKGLLALSGLLPGYDKRIDVIHAAISKATGGEA